MEVLVVGGGGREAALAWKLSQSPTVSGLWVTHDNPGFPEGARKLPAGDVAEQADLAGVGLVVVGPEAPLAEGLADRCIERGVPVFGPVAAAAQLEASKAFAKDFMKAHGIPTADYGHFTDAEAAHAAIQGPCVVKADGLAAGKGVFVCEEASKAHEAVDHIFGTGMGATQDGAAVVVEELLLGEELSVLALCDGERFVLLPPAQDHKRRFDRDEGPNTGGMGAYAPAPRGTPELLEQVSREVIAPVLAGMKAAGTPFQGTLYAGLMLTEQGPKVLEFNVRFGDPECQPLMVLLDEDLGELLLSCALGGLEVRPLKVHSGAACCVVMVSDGYPGSYPKGLPIQGLEAQQDGVVVFQAGTRQEGDAVVTNGGRVLGVTALGADIRSARDAAYGAIESISFQGASFRTDIAYRAL
ncbi:MAG: phosphoribosylamine--glycine ligase [Myxococcota bacterium]|nr:phosphoribosylamine--glycine ligase [Myxococcota bacterium]